MSLDLFPRAVRLALAWEGLRSPQEYLSFLDGDEPHRVGRDPLPRVVSALQALTVWAALPAPGDPQGLGPGLRPALDAGEAVLVTAATGRWALVPDAESFGTDLEPGVQVTWRVLDADDGGAAAPSSSVGEVRLALVTQLHSATDALTALDVMKERPELREAFLDLTGPPDRDAADLLGVLEDRPAALLLQALRVLRIVDLATQDDGAAVTLGQIAARTAALQPLSRAARAAVAVATHRRVEQDRPPGA